MAICKFYKRGDCRNGSSCRFEHPGAQTNAVATNNRFSAFQSPPSTGFSEQGRDSRVLDNPPYSLTREAILADLSTERPQWILSAYGPGLKAPAQLWGGELKEQSFEEVRLHYYLGMASGNPAAAAQQADSLVQEAELQIHNALQNVDGALQYILSAENQHPNRIDICNGNDNGNSNGNGNGNGAPNGGFAAANPFSNTTGPAASNPFGAPRPAAPPLNQPSALGQRPNPFATTQPTSGAFGAPSALGVKSSPFGAPSQTSGAFGAPSALGVKPNPFGTPAQATSSVFGAPSALSLKPNPFGAASQSQNAFGTPSQTVGNTFVQPTQPSQINAFGANPAADPNPFGQPVAPAQNNAFAAPPPPAANPFGAPSQPAANPFEKPAQPRQTANSFGGQPQAQPVTQSPFGAPPQPTAPNPFITKPVEPAPTISNQFAASSQPAPTNPFGTSNPPVQPNPFGALPQHTQQQNPFGAPPPSQPSKSNPFGGGIDNPAQSQPQTNGVSQGYKPLAATTSNGIVGDKSPYPPGSQVKHPQLTTYATVQPDGRVTMFKGKAVQYREGVAGTMNRADRTWEKIWFPEGPPGFNSDTQVDGSLLSEEMKKSYEHARETGTFEGGLMPLMPPMREWCIWDF